MPFSHKILIVDDEEMARNFLVSLLSKCGHECETAKDGIEALEKIKKSSFDSAVIDVVMPLIDGITLTKELVKLYPDLPIMIMTGHVHEHSAKSAIDVGAREFKKKPFSLPEFIIRFDKMMRHHETLCKMKGKYSKMLFHLQRNSSEEIERLKGQIKTFGGRWSYFYDPND